MRTLELPMFASCAGELPHWSYLDAADASGRDLRGYLDGFIQSSGLDQIESGQHLLGFSERTIRDGHLSVADAHSLGGTHGLKGLGGKALARTSEVLVKGHTSIVGHGAYFLLFTIDKA
jgi:hypothetical protein